MSRHPFFGILSAIVIALAAHPSATLATTITVTTTADELNSDGDCSLREAVQAANTNAAVDACPAGQSDQVDTIIVPAGTYTLTLAGTEGGNNGDDNTVGDLDIKDAVTITGAGAATTIIQACDVEQQVDPCPAGHGVLDRVFDIGDSDATISGVTIRHGRAGTQPGQGIFVRQIFAPAALTLTDAVVTKNGTTSTTTIVLTKGGGIAVQNAATATLTRVTVSDNVLANSGGTGGGIGNDGAEASLVMTDCTVSGNQSGSNGGGIYNNNGSAIITSTTISGNTTVEGSGGGFGNSHGTATLTNCTVSGNEADGPYGGGIFTIGGGSVNIRSCTITLNQGAGGLAALGTNSTTLRNTIIAGNTTDISVPSRHAPDCYGAGTPAIVSEGHNLLGEALHCPELGDGVNGNQIGTQDNPLDAKLGPLAGNGGPTLTHTLLLDSPAIDAADPAMPGSGGTACPAQDQRGAQRPGGVACDIGSVELGTGGALHLDSVQPARGGNAGTVQMLVYGTGFVSGATVKLVRSGFADVVGAATGVRGLVLATSFDLRGVSPGVWSVVVENPDTSTATLTDAFTVEIGGAPEIWSTLLMPLRFISGRFQSLYVQFGNRGTVDAYGVPIWISFPNELEFHVPFAVSAPPAQPGQIATDWKRIAIDATIPPPADRNSFPLLLPVVPAGSTGVVKIRVKSPVSADASRLPFSVTADIGAPYFQPDLSNGVVAGYVARAKEYAQTASGTTAFPSDATIETYVRTQLANVVANGRADAVANPGGYPPVYSQAQLIVDTGQFIAGESATALAPALDRSWLARLISDFGTRSADARLVDPDCDPGDSTCERNPPTCNEDPKLCNTDPPVITCDRANLINDEFVFVPCKPKDEGHRPLTASGDPNDKMGPGSPGGFIDGLTPLPYSILFENVATASGDAFEVTVTDPLDVSKYDLDTFSLGPISFGSTFVPVPAGLKSYSTEVDLRPGVNILVGINAALDTGTGVVTWKFTTLDPATHQFPEDPQDGFLPPNVTQPEGEGAVLFTVRLKPGFALGTTVCNQARIVFDLNAPIDTPNFCNTVGAPEDCDNCVDDDGDGLIDRADPDCAPLPNGGGAGVGGDAAKAVGKCATAIRKVGTKLVTMRLKALGGCEKAVADCVQLKPGDGACLTKAQATCTKARLALPAAEAKLTAAIGTSCNEPALASANLLAATGLGFGGDAGPCAGRGVASLATAADVTECIRRENRCDAERILGAAVPRAGELLVLGGFDPETDLACVATGANGGGSGLATEKRKAIRKCDAALQKAATKLLAGRTKAGEACGAAAFACVQSKPGDTSCLDKARAQCTKAFAALPKLETDFTAVVAKGCGAAPLTPTDLLAPDGLGAAALAERCAALGVPSLETVADVTACLERQISCRANGLLEHATPRFTELLGLGGVTHP